MVRKKKEISMETCVQDIVPLTFQFPELNWGFSQKLDLGRVCSTQMQLGLNSDFKIIKLDERTTWSQSLTCQFDVPSFGETVD